MKLTSATFVALGATTALAIWPPPPPQFHLKTESTNNSTNDMYVSITPMADAPWMTNRLSGEEPQFGSFMSNTTSSGKSVLAYIFNSSPSLTQAAWIDHQDDNMNDFMVHSLLEEQDRYDEGFLFKDDYLYYQGKEKWYACSPNGDGYFELRWFQGGAGVSYPCSEVRVTRQFLPQIMAAPAPQSGPETSPVPSPSS